MPVHDLPDPAKSRRPANCRNARRAVSCNDTPKTRHREPEGRGDLPARHREPQRGVAILECEEDCFALLAMTEARQSHDIQKPVIEIATALWASQ